MPLHRTGHSRKVEENHFVISKCIIVVITITIIITIIIIIIIIIVVVVIKVSKISELTKKFQFEKYAFSRLTENENFEHARLYLACFHLNDD